MVPARNYGAFHCYAGSVGPTVFASHNIWPRIVRWFGVTDPAGLPSGSSIPAGNLQYHPEHRGQPTYSSDSPKILFSQVNDLG